MIMTWAVARPLLIPCSKAMAEYKNERIEPGVLKPRKSFRIGNADLAILSRECAASVPALFMVSSKDCFENIEEANAQSSAQ
jgi:hypothetical protein